MTIYDLPSLNATLNALSTCLIVSGLILIRRGNKKAHGRAMTAAFCTSALFLISYLTYHFAKPEPVRFTTPGWPRGVYLATLISHSILAPIAAVMVLITVILAAKKSFDRHKKWARWTYPIWLYVSVTGVLVYFMLYQWWPSAVLQKYRNAATEPQASSTRLVAK